MTQAFVYKWIHKPTGMWYIGSRTAEGCHINDGYICSSKIVKPMILNKPEEWERSILHTGDSKDMRKMETRLLTESNAKGNPMSFNRNNATGPNDKSYKKRGTKMNEIIPAPLVNNQKIKTGRGGSRAGSGRKKGAIQKLGGKELLEAIEIATGKSFADNIAEHYFRAIQAGEWYDVRDYEKFIIAKVISDVKEVDITTNGKDMAVQLVFNPVELPEWKK